MFCVGLIFCVFQEIERGICVLQDLRFVIDLRKRVKSTHRPILSHLFHNYWIK